MLLERALGRAAPSASEPPPDFSGEWKNQLGSVMKLTVSGASLSGDYTSAESAKGGPICGKLAGYVNGDLIAFTVNWPTAAITAWVGQLVPEHGKEVIRTLWQMTTNIEEKEEPSGLWHSVYAGSDWFTRS